MRTKKATTAADQFMLRHRACAEARTSLRGLSLAQAWKQATPDQRDWAAGQVGLDVPCEFKNCQTCPKVPKLTFARFMTAYRAAQRGRWA